LYTTAVTRCVNCILQFNGKGYQYQTPPYNIDNLIYHIVCVRAVSGRRSEGQGHLSSPATESEYHD